MDHQKLSFERFTRAIAQLKLDDKPAKATAHTASVVDFSNWDVVRRELEFADSLVPADEPRRC